MSPLDGGRLDVALLRPVEWLEDCEAAPGATVYLELPELGAEGPVEVLAVEPCPPIRPAPSPDSRLVTGTFAHGSGEVLDVSIEGLAEPIGCTANHPFWSEDRQAFIPAGALRPGETLRTATGDLRHVVQIARRRTSEPVYNLEVDGEHVYYVSSTGVLVHNSCDPKRIVVDPERFPESAQHLEEAGAVGRVLRVNRQGAARNRAAALRGRAKVAGRDLDEAPPAVLREAGAPVSVRPVPPGDNRGSGASIGNQLRGVPEGGEVIIDIPKLGG
ncbi:MAG: polymorphic toxin-type HINT domain-containing protein [Planctomycetia bacterium]|nr:polymorphic toxin-type HINT domain-containing protein [Planctomycetia bacterium]